MNFKYKNEYWIFINFYWKVDFVWRNNIFSGFIGSRFVMGLIFFEGNRKFLECVSFLVCRFVVDYFVVLILYFMIFYYIVLYSII